MGAVEYRFTIKELPVEERPREKLMLDGAVYLSNAELLGLIIGTGSRKRTAVELAQDLINYAGGLVDLIGLSCEELMQVKGIGPAKAAQIKALLELSNRLVVKNVEEKEIIHNPSHVAQLVMNEMRYLGQEVFKIILLDVKNQVIAIPEISRGGLASSIVHPREVFKEAIRRSSAAMILIHNHPSGIPEPSRDDLQITNKLIKTGELIGIPVLDHLIIGDGIFFSMKEKGII